MKLQHLESARTITVADDMAAMYQSQGWREVAGEAPVEVPAPKRTRAPRKPRTKK